MIPKRFENAKYEEIPAEIREKFEKIHETRKGLYIHGDVGTGKTHIAYALKRKWDEKSNHPAKFLSTTELLREMRLDFDRDNYSKKRLDEEIMESKHLLFLDDVGAEKITDWVGETFYLIVNKRYNDMVPIIFTSNLPIAALAERIGDRTVSRIVEMCDVVELVGEDRRVINQNKTQIKV
jgi:DNA replication protein DnaC